MRTLWLRPSPIAPGNIWRYFISHLFSWYYFGGIVDDEGFFSFLLKLNSHHPNTFTSPLQQTLKQNQRASSNCYSVKNMLKPLAFKWLLNELLVETKLSEVMLITWFVSIKFIKPFLMFFQTIPLVISTSVEKLFFPFPSTDIIVLALFCFSSAFFFRKVSFSFFLLPIFLIKL